MTKPTPTCRRCGQSIAGTVAWIGRDAFHIFCTEDAGLLSANEEITRLRSRVAELEGDAQSLRRVVEDVHASLCEEVESLMDAGEGTPRAARLELWAAHVNSIEDVLFAKDFELSARSLLSPPTTENGNG